MKQSNEVHVGLARLEFFSFRSLSSTLRFLRPPAVRPTCVATCPRRYAVTPRGNYYARFPIFNVPFAALFRFTLPRHFLEDSFSRWAEHGCLFTRNKKDRWAIDRHLRFELSESGPRIQANFPSKSRLVHEAVSLARFPLLAIFLLTIPFLPLIDFRHSRTKSFLSAPRTNHRRTPRTVLSREPGTRKRREAESVFSWPIELSGHGKRGSKGWIFYG